MFFPAVGTVLIVAVVVIVAIALLAATIRTVPQAHVAVVTMFGKYRRMLSPGLGFLIPFIETIALTVPIQNRTSQLKFSAITKDQAAVHFSATIIYSVTNHDEETVKLVAFKFIDEASFSRALASAVEASVREFVSGQAQEEILGQRQAIVAHAKTNLDHQLASWGYTISDLQINDVTFDAEVMASMSKVVAALNLKKSATNEGEAFLIKSTAEANAKGVAIKIAAVNEAEASRLRGVGQAQFRKEIASGLADSAAVLKNEGVSEDLLAFTMWNETIRGAAREGTGNVILLDGNLHTMEDTVKRLGTLTAIAPIQAKTEQELAAAAAAAAAAAEATVVAGSAKATRAVDHARAAVQVESELLGE